MYSTAVCLAAPKNHRHISRNAASLLAFVTLLCSGGHMAHATDFTVNSATTTIVDMTGANDTADVTSSGSITLTNGAGILSENTVTNGSISNEGTINTFGMTYAILNQGTLLNISNSGSISTEGYGAFNDAGTIGTFTNTGTIVADTTNGGYISGLYNAGTITTLVNTGSITATATNDVGIDNNYGTIGTLINGQAALTFQGNAPTLYKTYFSNSTTYGSIYMTLYSGGAMNYSLAIANGQSYQVGTYTSVIKADTAVTLTDIAVNGITYNTVQDGTCSGGYAYCYDLIITSIGGGGGGGGGGNVWTSAGNLAGGVGTTMGSVLDRVAGGSSALSTNLSTLSSLSAGQQSQGIKQLAPTAVTTQILNTGTTINPTNDIIFGHGEDIVGGLKGMSSGDAYASFAPTALWGQILGNKTNAGSTSSNDGFNASSFGLLVGLDLYKAAHADAGLALDWLRTSANGTSDASNNSTVIDSYQLSGYGTWRPDGGPLYVQGSLGFGMNQYSETRGINFLNETDSAKYNGIQFNAKINGGYDIPLQYDVITTPIASVQVTTVRNNAYTETGGVAAQSVASQTFTSVEHVLGDKLSRGFDTSLGHMIGEVQAGWEHDYINSPIASTAVLGGVSYNINTARLPANGAMVGAGVTLKQKNNMTIRLEYDGDIRPDYTSHTGMLKAKLAF